MYNGNSHGYNMYIHMYLFSSDKMTIVRTRKNTLLNTVKITSLVFCHFKKTYNNNQLQQPTNLLCSALTLPRVEVSSLRRTVQSAKTYRLIYDGMLF